MCNENVRSVFVIWPTTKNGQGTRLRERRKVSHLKCLATSHSQGSALGIRDGSQRENLQVVGPHWPKNIQHKRRNLELISCRANR